VRRLVADAAVLGTTFPAEALIAMSGQEEPTARAALTELVRREVFTVSADPLSPERGSYRFAQQMLRQVAYDTLSRRDRKARHLAVAAHLRAAFPGDGEEVAEVIARHYLDALDAMPDDTDAGQIRDQAIAALIRAAERARRTGAPAGAAASYVTAAELTGTAIADGQQASAAASLWEYAAESAYTNADYAEAAEQAAQAGELYRQGGEARSAARAQVIAGRALHRRGRHAQAREQLTAALAVLRDDPDADTVRALGELAALEVHAGSPAADALSAEALALGQDLAVDDATLAGLFTTRGICHGHAGRRPEAASYFREAARLAGQADDSLALGRALLNLADAVTGTDPAAGAVAARAAAAQLRRAGARRLLAAAVENLAQALLMTGDWDAADAELAQALEADGLADIEFLACDRAWLAALRGEVPTAQATLARLDELRATEDPQDQAIIAVAEAFTAAIAGLRQHSTPYHLAHGLLDHAEHLLRMEDHDAAAAAIGEAQDMAERLGCQPLLGRAADLSRAEPRIKAPMVTAPGPGESAAAGDG